MGQKADQTPLIEAKELRNELQLRVRKPDLRYLDELLRLKCGPDLLELGLFPNAKEVPGCGRWWRGNGSRG